MRAEDAIARNTLPPARINRNRVGRRVHFDKSRGSSDISNISFSSSNSLHNHNTIKNSDENSREERMRKLLASIIENNNIVKIRVNQNIVLNSKFKPNVGGSNP